ncbi:MAG: plasmid pRiA4b ORF-3 family protein [Candidatus Methanoperedens sp.]|nr:plasmid pRiA4b ORF-3 family protein [Candidatus Methanoperedens sp.]
MKRKFTRIYQFKITLEGIRPPIWRRIQVPETYTFWDMHVAIQDAMGWLDYHLHEFEILNPTNGLKVNIGLPDEEFRKRNLLDWAQKIADYFSPENPSADYIYDFGDYWQHKIQLEKIFPREKNVDYPICVKGKRAAPPEDCGGVSGYENILSILKNPGHAEYEETIEWLGEEFDPEHFDPKEIYFDDPAARRKMALETA